MCICKYNYKLINNEHIMITIKYARHNVIYSCNEKAKKGKTTMLFFEYLTISLLFL